MRGTGVPLVTPFDASGEVEDARLGELVEWVEARGVDFLVPCGSTSEAELMSVEERAHVVEAVVAGEGRESRTVDVVGPICESGDFLARDRTLPLPRSGDLLVVRTAGAYGFVMTMHYNGRPRAAEVLVDGSATHLIRRREELLDLVRGESIPAAAEATGSTPARRER